MSSPFARRESASRSSPPPTAATRARASSDVEHSLIDWEQLFETGSVHNQASREQSDALVRDRTRRRATAIILDVEERRIKGAKKPTARSDAAAASHLNALALPLLLQQHPGNDCGAVARGRRWGAASFSFNS